MTTRTEKTSTKKLVKSNTDDVPEYVPWVEDPEYLVYDDGRIFSQISGKFLKSRLTMGYERVTLRSNGLTKQPCFFVHRMVAQMFCENPDEKPQVDHIDRNPLNNHYTNLRWTNQSENMLNRAEGGCGAVKIQQWLPDMSEMIAEFDSQMEAERVTGCNSVVICRCCKGKAQKTRDSNGVWYTWRYSNEQKPKETSGPDDGVPIVGHEKYLVTPDGKIWSNLTRQYRNPNADKNGFMYFVIKFTDEDGKKKSQNLKVHRLVAEAFIENKPENYQNMLVAHKNGDKKDNRVENLEYASKSQISNKIVAKKERRVLLCNQETDEVEHIMDNPNVAAEFLKVSRHSVVRAISGDHKTCGGYVLKYE